MPSTAYQTTAGRNRSTCAAITSSATATRLADASSGAYNPGTAAVNIPSMLRNSNARAHNVSGSWVHTFGPSAVLQAQFGRVLQWSENYDKYNSLPSDFISKVEALGQHADALSERSDSDARTERSQLLQLPEGFTHQVNGDNYSAKVGFSKLVGSHTFKLGGEYTRVGYNTVIENSNEGFADAQTADPSRIASTGGSLASFLLGVPDSATRRDAIETMPRFAGVMGFYFQDSWKASGKLTLNLGLRYDRTFTPSAGTEAKNNNKMGDMDFQRGIYILQAMAPPCSQVGKFPCIPAPAGAPAGWLPPNVVLSPNGKILQDTTKNFQPRVGFAYRTGPKMAIRGAIGVFFDNYSGVTQIARNPIGTWPSLGFQSASNLNYPTPTQILPSVPASNPLPSASLPLADPFAQTAYFFNRKLAECLLDSEELRHPARDWNRVAGHPQLCRFRQSSHRCRRPLWHGRHARARRLPRAHELPLHRRYPPRGTAVGVTPTTTPCRVPSSAAFSRRSLYRFIQLFKGHRPRLLRLLRGGGQLHPEPLQHAGRPQRLQLRHHSQRGVELGIRPAIRQGQGGEFWKPGAELRDWQLASQRYRGSAFGGTSEPDGDG